MTTETIRDYLIDQTMANTSFDYSDKLSVAFEDENIARSSNRKKLKPPFVNFTFMPIKGAYKRFINDVLDYRDSDYKQYGFPQEEIVEIRVTTKQMDDDDGNKVNGQTLAGFCMEQLKNYVMSCWPELLYEQDRGAIRQRTLETHDESHFEQGSSLFTYVMRFTIITTTSWRYVPESATETGLITAFSGGLNDDGDGTSTQIEVE